MEEENIRNIENFSESDINQIIDNFIHEILKIEAKNPSSLNFKIIKCFTN